MPARAAGDELGDARHWIAAAFDPGGAALPFSFTYGGRSSRDLLPGWRADVTRRRLGRRRTEHMLTWHDPATGLTVRCVAVEYEAFPTIEWTLYLENPTAP